LLHPYHPAEPGKKNRINQSDDQEIFTLSKLGAVLRHQTAIPVQEKKTTYRNGLDPAAVSRADEHNVED
jgi:hypothetical protein